MIIVYWVLKLIAHKTLYFLVAINIYLPYYSDDNYDNYLFYIGKLMSIIEEVDNCGVMVLGDFNCNVGSTFYQEWILACEGHGLTFSDVEKLPASTYTHVNNFSLGRMWLDHYLCSQTVHIAIENV